MNLKNIFLGGITICMAAILCAVILFISLTLAENALEAGFAEANIKQLEQLKTEAFDKYQKLLAEQFALEHDFTREYGKAYLSYTEMRRDKNCEHSYISFSDKNVRWYACPTCICNVNSKAADDWKNVEIARQASDKEQSWHHNSDNKQMRKYISFEKTYFQPIETRTETHMRAKSRMAYWRETYPYRYYSAVVSGSVVLVGLMVLLIWFCTKSPKENTAF